MTAQTLTSDRLAMHKPVAQVVHVSKTYRRGAQSVHALRNDTPAPDPRAPAARSAPPPATFPPSSAPRSFPPIRGPSGSGKSPLLHVPAGLARPTRGDVRIGASDLSRLSEKALTRLRRDRIGFV